MKTWNVIWGVARRTLKNALTNPQILLPTLMFPLFFFVAFAGGLSQVAQVPGFDFPPGYTAFQFVFVLLQSAAFSGVFTGFGVARDFEGGFAKRLMLAAPRRSGIVLGYALAALRPLVGRRGAAHGDRVRRRDERRRRRCRPRRALHPRGARQLLRLLLGRRDRDALPHDPGGAAHADARLPDPVLRARLRAARAARGMDPRRRRRSIRVTYILETGRGFVAGDAPHIAGAFAIAHRPRAARSGSGRSAGCGTPRPRAPRPSTPRYSS